VLLCGSTRARRYKNGRKQRSGGSHKFKKSLGIYPRTRGECGYEDRDYNIVQRHAEAEHGKGSVIEKVVGNWSYPYTV